MVELEKTSLAERSRRLFTLSAIYHATCELLKDVEETEPRETAELALKFWETVANHLSEWQLVRDGEMTAGELRKDYIHTHGVVLQALARTGQVLIKRYPRQWPTKLAGIKTMDWKRSNSKLVGRTRADRRKGLQNLPKRYADNERHKVASAPRPLGRRAER